MRGSAPETIGNPARDRVREPQTSPMVRHRSNCCTNQVHLVTLWCCLLAVPKAKPVEGTNEHVQSVCIVQVPSAARQYQKQAEPQAAHVHSDYNGMHPAPRQREFDPWVPPCW